MKELVRNKKKSVLHPAEAGTEKSNQETILNCVADGVFTVDNNKKIRFFNRSAEKITGFSAKEAVGLPCSDVFRTSLCSTKCTLEEVKHNKQSK